MRKVTIAQAAKRTSLTPDTLRYYERIGLIPPVERTQGGIRNYCEQDCRWISFIKCMRSAGLPVEILIEYVALFQEGDKTLEARKAILLEQREQLLTKIHDMQDTLKRLDCKIEHYDTIGLPADRLSKKHDNAENFCSLPK